MPELGHKAPALRAVTFRAFVHEAGADPASAGTERIVGRPEEVDNKIDDLELLNTYDTPRSYIIEETSMPGPDLGGRTFPPPRVKTPTIDKQLPDPPEVLEQTELDIALLRDARTDSAAAHHILRIMRTIGVFTCADALAAGKNQLAYWSRYIEGGMNSVLGPGRFQTLDKTLWRTTTFYQKTERGLHKFLRGPSLQTSQTMA